MQSNTAGNTRDDRGLQTSRLSWRTTILAFFSFAAAFACHAQTNVLTYHNDNGRTGQNLNETILTPLDVNSTSFGSLTFLSVDGLVDAEPLYVANLTVGGATHNVLFIVTENDSVYAFYADSYAQLWHASVLGANETPSDNRGCAQVSPQIGITSTPVIDPSAGPHGTIFLVAMSTDGNGNYFQRLHALDITTGAEQSGSPKLITGTFPGTGANSSNGQVLFDPKQYKERAALLLQGGLIYTTWASHCDDGLYTGWVMAYSESTLQQVAVLNVTPNGSDGAIWMSGAGPAADASGNIYFLDANGTFDTTLTPAGFPNQGDYGNAFIKLGLSGNTLSVLDYFTMSDTVTESGLDEDLGSGGALVLPDQTDASGKVWQLAVGVGKGSVIYVVNRNSMGKYNSGGDIIYQEISGALNGGAWSMPAYFNGTLYYGTKGDSLKALSITNAQVATSAASQSSATFGYPGTTPSVSANGTSNGIVWAIQNGSTAVLHAYSATNLATELYNSSQAGTRDQFAGNKYITPMIVNGKVYVGTPTGVAVFGLLNIPTTPLFSPAGGAVTSTQPISITDGTPGTTIYYTTDGSTPSPGAGTTQQYTGTFTLPASATVEAIAVATASSTKSTLATTTFTVSSGSSSPAKAISIDFVGLGTPMGGSEQAGVVLESNWNNASGAAHGSPLALLDSTGASTTVTVTWSADDVWDSSIQDQAGNVRMMKGYLDNGNVDTTTVTVSGLPGNSAGYSVYVYAQGTSSSSTHTGIYQLSGAGITTSSVALTYNSNFNGTFTQATSSNANGNYIVFTIPNVTGFQLAAIPSTASNGVERAPVNGIQIVPVGSAAPNFTLSGASVTSSVTQGGTATYTVSGAAVNGFAGTVNLAVTGLPAGTSSSFAPSSISLPGGSTLSVTTTGSTPVGSVTLTITGTSGALTHTTTVPLNVSASSGSGGGAVNPISIDFVGLGTSMGSSEQAGVVPESNWNNATGAVHSSPFALLDSTGASTTATVTWSSDNVWDSSIQDQAGNIRMMKGYLDNGNVDTTTVSVTGLPGNSGGYTVYVYAQGSSNSSATNTGIYQLSGTGITTSSVALTYNSNFNGTFTQVTASNANGNYIVFTIPNVTGFQLAAIPSTASNGVERAPVNGIQIVPVGSAAPNFTISASPSTQPVKAGGSATYTASVAALNGFTGAVNLSVTSALPTGVTASFNPTSIAPGATSTLTAATTSGTAVGSPTLTITGTSGSLTQSTGVVLNVTAAPADTATIS